MHVSRDVSCARAVRTSPAKAARAPDRSSEHMITPPYRIVVTVTVNLKLSLRAAERVGARRDRESAPVNARSAPTAFIVEEDH